MPLIAEWRAGLSAEGGEAIRYRPLQDGLNLRPVSFGKVAFGAVDAPITPDQYGTGTVSIAMMPWAVTGLALVYNLDGVSAPVRLNRDVLAEIILGNIKRWNDPALASLNPGVSLPNTPIRLIVPAGENGEDYVMSDYLKVYRGAHRKHFGILRELSYYAKVASVKADVAAAIKNTNGALGYVPSIKASRAGLAVARLENPAGRFVAPNPESLAAGAETGARRGPNNEVWLKELPHSARSAYPLLLFSYGIVPISSLKPAEVNELKKFLSYVFRKGSPSFAKTGFVEVPPKMLRADTRTMENISP